MPEAPRRRITSAHVMAGLALFISIGGGAYAASTIPDGSVGTAQIKNGAVTSKKLKKHSVTGSKIANNAVGASQLNVSSLTGLVKGNGQLQSRTASIPANNTFTAPAVLADVPGFGQVQLLFCGTQANLYRVFVRMLSFTNANSFLAVGQGWGHHEPGGTPQPATIDGSAGDLANGGGTLISATTTNTAGGMDATFDIQFWRGSSTSPTGSHTSVALLNDGTNCRASAQTIIQK